MFLPATALSILALTVGLSLGRPRVGRLNIDHAPAAVLGALLCVAFGVIATSELAEYLTFLARPVVTIVSLMTATLIAEQTGLFEFVARRIARAAAGDGKRLFLYIFAIGSLTGTLFTNDAAVLIFTPLVYRLVEDIGGDEWSAEQKLPFYFAVLYVANVAGPLVISNPVNIVVSRMLGISFLEYARWMMVPALVSIAVSYAGIRIIFRRQIPDRFEPLPQRHIDADQWRGMTVCAVVLVLTLVAFFAGERTGVPIWAVAVCAALALLVLHPQIARGATYGSVARGISWDVIVFLVGIFLITRGVKSACMTDDVTGALSGLAEQYPTGSLHATGFGAAALSAFMNNHPTADMLGLVIADLDMDLFGRKLLGFAALIGSDLGPKMLPIGSLAALMWFGLLRRRGVEVSYRRYIAIGVPVTLSAVLLSLLTLDLEILLFTGG